MHVCDVIVLVEVLLAPLILLVVVWRWASRNWYAIRGTVKAISSIREMSKREPDKIEAFFSSYEVYGTDAIMPNTQHCIVDYYHVLNNLCTI